MSEFMESGTGAPVRPSRFTAAVTSGMLGANMRAVSNVSPPREESLSRARELGRRETEAFLLRLERREQEEREKRLAELAWKGRRPQEQWDDEEASLRVVELEARLQELNRYVSAVEGSLPWRTIQWVRRLFGRAW